MTLKHILFTMFTVIFLLIFNGFLFASGEILTFPLGDSQECKIEEGSITLEHNASSYISPGTLILRDLKGKRALVGIGKEFPVESGKSYYLSVWIETVGVSRFRTQARSIIKWYDGAHKEIGILETPWAIGDYDWLEYGNAGTAPENAVTGKTFIEVVISSLGPPPPGFKPVTFAFNHLTVSRTPRISIETGRQCNLVFEGDPLKIDIAVDDIPENFKNTAIQGEILDYWRKPVAAFEITLTEQSISKTFMFSNLPRGYYSVEWKLKKNGKTERKDIFSASIVPSLHSRLQDRDTPYAFDSGLSSPFDGKHDVTLTQGLYMAQTAGVHWLRERSGPKEMAQREQNMGIDPYYILASSFYNCLRNSDPADSSSGSLNLLEVYEGSKKLAQEYGDLVKFWETWNEPDVFFSPTRAEEFAAISKAAYLGTHRGNPNSQILLGSFSTVSNPWHEDLMRNGMNEYFDIFNMHYYDTYDPDFKLPVGVVERIRRNNEILDRCGINRKPNWITEMGYYCFKSQDGTWWRSEQEQAVHAVRSICYSLAKGVNKFFLFYLQEFLENSRYVWGVTRRNWTPKPAYTAYANLTYMLGKGRYIGYFDLGLPNSSGYVFESGNGPVLVAWAQEAGSLSLPGKNLSAVDIMGAPASPDKISRYPMYVTGIDLKSLRFHPVNLGTPQYTTPDIEKLSTFLSLRAVREKDAPLYPRFSSKVRKQPMVIDLNENIELELKVCNFSNEAKEINLQWNLPKGWQFVEKEYRSLNASPWSEQNIIVHLKQLNTKSGEYYAIQINGIATGRTITPAFVRVQVK